MKSETIGKLAEALAKAQSMMRPIARGSANPFYQSKYTDLATLWEAIREPLTKNGLSVVQTMRRDERGVVVVTYLMHTSGEWIASECFIPPVKQGPHEYGSAISYARRYSLAAIVGAVSEGEDDDANVAAGVNKEPVKSQPVKTTKEEEPIKAQSATKAARITQSQAKKVKSRLAELKIPEWEFLARLGRGAVEEMTTADLEKSKQIIEELLEDAQRGT